MRKGFTLIEILVVVAIIGFLAGIVLVSLQSVRERAIIARAKVEMTEIMKAAEMVKTTYGYYPNDSHASVTCPRNIIIELASGTKWETFTNACNDPYGNPYEWDNVCFSGEPRKADGSYPACPPFSDLNSGPIGIVMVGRNGINDDCTQDDICFGINGHLLYGWTSNGGTNGGAEPTCYTVIASCNGLSNPLCEFRTGCSLSSPVCSGQYQNDCSGFSDQTSCEEHTGCTWVSSGSCSGSPPACSTYTSEGECLGAPGCSWQACSGTPNSCSTYSSQGGCEGAGCSWASGGCSGTAAACSTWDGNQAVCDTQQGCSYNTKNNKCTGTHEACSVYGTQGVCETNLNCSWQAGGCSGTPFPCSSYTTPASCSSAGCTGMNCSGTPTSCSTYGTEPLCTAATGCTWEGTGSCTGEYTEECSVFSDQSSCEAIPTCSWDVECVGTAVSCSTFTDEDSCNLQPGCSWE